MTTLTTDAFVPLTTRQAAPGTRPDFRLLVVNAAEGARPAHPQPGPAVKVLEPSTPKPACEAQVSLERDGERVTAIHIQCSCGQVIDLSCVY